MMKNRQPGAFERVIRSDRAEAERLIDEALSYLDGLRTGGVAIGVSDFNFRLVLDEALENAIRHGNRLDPDKRVSVCIRGRGSKVDITISDEGDGFRDGDVPHPVCREDLYAPHGRGVCLMKGLGTARWNRQGNSVKVVLDR